MIAKSINSSTAQQPLSVEISNSSNNRFKMVINDAHQEPENLNNGANDQRNDEAMVIITDNKT